LSRALLIALALIVLAALLFGCTEDTGESGDDDTEESDDNDDDSLGDSFFFCSENHPDRTVGLISCRPEAEPGYALIAPLEYPTTYLVDRFGKLVHTWESDYAPGLAAYLLEDGTLLRTANLGTDRSQVFTAGGGGGRIERFDWNGDLLWEFDYFGDEHLQHHDLEMLPNGNLLMIAWEAATVAEAVAAGRNPNLLRDGILWVDTILEIAPTGSSGGAIVWKWRVWDHLVQDLDPSKSNYAPVAQHPERVDFNYAGIGQADWTHTNSVDYNEDLDQIMISVLGFQEIWVIDHSTTTEQAAEHAGGRYGKGGDLLYRWGNPEAYRAGTSESRRLHFQHDAQWIPQDLPGQGDLLVFNNGTLRPEGDYSSVDQIALPTNEDGSYAHIVGEPFGPEASAWTYVDDPPQRFFSRVVSGAHRLRSGNTFICDGNWGRLLEITPDGKIVWEYISPVGPNGPMVQGQTVPPREFGTENWIFKAQKYAPEHPGLQGKDLTPGDAIELSDVKQSGGKS
jgi:Arylsulfotransferase (ASST)